jgi:hypothetical protein
MITTTDIEQILNVTSKQVEMAIYSGCLPPPTIDGNGWEDDHIEWFIQAWAARIKRAKPKDDRSNFMSGQFTFPQHQR